MRYGELDSLVVLANRPEVGEPCLPRESGRGAGWGAQGGTEHGSGGGQALLNLNHSLLLLLLVI